MPLSFKSGDLFQERAEAIVNTVNCVGVMGKGVALEFKKRWPENFRAYKRLCDQGGLRPGKLFIFENADMFDPCGRRLLVNFPTKDHWREGSRLEFIEDGLDDLIEKIRRLRIRSVAMPPLGCGNGGLEWKTVKAILLRKLETIEDAEIVVFQPDS